MGKLVRQKSFYGVIPDENAVAKKTEVPSWSKDRVNASRRSQASTGQSHGKESKTKRSWSRGAYESVDLLVASDSPNGDWAGHTRAPNGRKRVPAIKGNNSIEFPSLRENNERNAPSTAKVIAMDSRTGINIGGECRDLGPVMKHLAAYLKLDRTHWELWDADENGYFAWPAELHVRCVGHDVIDAIGEPEMFKINIQCSSVSTRSRARPPAYTVFHSGEIFEEAKVAQMDPTKGIHVDKEWHLLGPLEDESYETMGYSRKIWVPFPVRLFRKVDSWMFKIDGRITVREGCPPVEIHSQQISISHLRLGM